ncbi:hypothetical protein [Sulfitobacter sp. 1A13679]|uniref:hypothetical protein n=1 Tax=Sulfitobacter sp. 1A13679 TaxID=3368597 RepID=UPI003744C1E5
MSEIDPDREVEDMMRLSWNASLYVGRKLNSMLDKEKPKTDLTHAQKHGAKWLRTAEIARDRSRSNDPFAADLIEMEAYFRARHTTNMVPTKNPLPGRRPLEATRMHAEKYRGLRRAYEFETGKCAATGKNLTRSQMNHRAALTKPGLKAEAKLLNSENAVDSKLYQTGREEMDGVRRSLEDVAKPVKQKRKAPAQLAR